MAENRQRRRSDGVRSDYPLRRDTDLEEIRELLRQDLRQRDFVDPFVPFCVVVKERRSGEERRKSVRPQTSGDQRHRTASLANQTATADAGPDGGIAPCGSGQWNALEGSPPFKLEVRRDGS